MEKLPVDIFRNIEQFTSLNTFYPCNKSSHEVKKELQQICLDSYNSSRYMKESLFRDSIDKLVDNPKKQIKLFVVIEEPELVYYVTDDNINFSLNFLTQVIKMKINCLPLPDIHVYPHLIDIDLSRTQITDVSALANIQNLNLSHCENLTDVSALANVRVLNLSWCKRIRDVSNLINNEELNLLCCFDLMNLPSSANRLKKINICDCSKISDVSSLCNAITIDMRGCDRVRNISALTNVEFLDIANSYKIIDVSAITKVKELNINGNYMIEDVSMLVNLELLRMYNCYQIQTIQPLTKLKKLYTEDSIKQILLKTVSDEMKLILTSDEP
jgi:hypothetical protein